MTIEAESNSAAAAAYYDDANVANFYRSCWGGTDIHIGRYDSGHESVAEASAAMTSHLLDLSGVGPGDRVLDIACGYGGTLKMLAQRGCEAKGIDISSVCVEEARKTLQQAGLADKVLVERGDFHAIESEAESWEAVICQESIIHSGNRDKVFSEAYRVLRSGGIFAFSDILTGEMAEIDLVKAAFERLGAAAGATPQDYENMARRAGFTRIRREERPEDIETHYSKLAEKLAKSVEGLNSKVTASIAQSIACWQRAIAGGHITWACFVAEKPS